MTCVQQLIFAKRDAQYAAFQRKLLPTLPAQTIAGVRTPCLKAIAKTLDTQTASAFLQQLPHTYFEENQLHAFLLMREKDFGTCLDAVERFLPFIDNWATCDQLSPPVFGRHKPELLAAIRRWIASPQPYTVRFAIGMLQRHFLDADFDTSYPAMVAAVRSDEYYVRMMAAWYFATALAKQYDAALPYITERRLDPWVHNKAIRKAAESYRIPPERKTKLKHLAIQEKKVR